MNNSRAGEKQQNSAGKILVVDDDEVVLRTFEMKLRGNGFEVVTTKEYESATSLAQKTKPDVIVLDVNFEMTEVNAGLQWDGFNVGHWMKRFQEIAKIPVVFISVSAPEKWKKKAFETGAVAYYQKPIDFAVFTDELRKQIGKSEKK